MKIHAFFAKAFFLVLSLCPIATLSASSWQPLSPPTSPIARGSACLAVDPTSNRLILFGGMNWSLLRRADTWETRLRDEEWHAAWLDDTWEWDGMRWTRLNPDTHPFSRSGACLSPDPTGHLLLFGGNHRGPLGDTWRWDGTTWSSLALETGPCSRMNGCMAFDPIANRVILFGGDTVPALLNDTWEWDGILWSQRTPEVSPPCRFGSCMAFDPISQVLILFGGLGWRPDPTDADATIPFDDTWQWDGTTWTQLMPPVSPPARSLAQLAVNPATNRLVLFGGWDGSKVLSDTWEWDGTTWSPLSPSTTPPARYGACLAPDPSSNRLILFGGEKPSTEDLCDTWELVHDNATVP